MQQKITEESFRYFCANLNYAWKSEESKRMHLHSYNIFIETRIHYEHGHTVSNFT